MILYNDISISFAYISNEHSMVFASQKGARLGATAPVRCSALQGLLPCDSPRSWSMWLYQGSNPASGYSSWWVGSNHSSPGSWRVFSLNLIEIPKKWHMFGIGNFFQELQRQRAMAEAYWGLLCTIASWSWLFSLCLAVPHVKTVNAWDLQEILARIAASIARAGRRLLLAGLGMSWVILWALRRLPWSSKQESRSHVACCSTFWVFFRHFRVFREN